MEKSSNKNKRNPKTVYAWGKSRIAGFAGTLCILYWLPMPLELVDRISSSRLEVTRPAAHDSLLDADALAPLIPEGFEFESESPERSESEIASNFQPPDGTLKGSAGDVVFSNLLGGMEAIAPTDHACPQGSPVKVVEDDLLLAGCAGHLNGYEGVWVRALDGPNYDVAISLWTHDAFDFTPNTPIVGSRCCARGLRPGVLYDAAAGCRLPSPGPNLPRQVWMRVEFYGNPAAGWLVANRAEVGFTANVVYRDGERLSLVAPGWAGAAAAVTASDLGLPPLNDDCRRPATLTSQDFTTECATTDGPPIPSCFSNFADQWFDFQSFNDLWYSYTGCTGNLTLDTCGSGFDTVLAVYDATSGCPTASTQLLACNDDSAACGSGSRQSKLTLSVSAQRQYLIRLGGYAGSAGEGRLSVQCSGTQDRRCLYRATCAAGTCSPGCPPQGLCVSGRCDGRCPPSVQSTCRSGECCVEYDLVECRVPMNEPSCPFEHTCEQCRAENICDSCSSDEDCDDGQLCTTHRCVDGRCCITLECGCDDCNENGVRDEDEIARDPRLDADRNGVLDACSFFDGGDRDRPTSWGLGTNWVPDGVPRQSTSVTIDRMFRVILDVRANIAGLRVADGALTFREDSTLAVGGPIVIGGGGRLLGSSRGQGSITAQNLTLRSGRCCPAELEGGELSLAGAMHLVVRNDLIIEGRGREVCEGLDRRQANPAPKFRGSNEVMARIRNFRADPGGPRIEFTSTSNMLLEGDFDNQSTSPEQFTWTSGVTLVAPSAPPDNQHRFEVAGVDAGPVPTDFGLENFSMGNIEVTTGRHVTFENIHANTAGVGPCLEALYVGRLTLAKGSRITLDNCRIYYDSLVDLGAIIETQGCCGELVQISSGNIMGGCDDGDPCTIDTCPGLTCLHSVNSCIDGNPCTTDSACRPGVGCLNPPNTAPCDDGCLFSVQDRCAMGLCNPGGSLWMLLVNLCWGGPGVIPTDAACPKLDRWPPAPQVSDQAIDLRDFAEFQKLYDGCER